MGIQASLNSLTGALLSGVRNVALLGKAKGMLEKPEAKAQGQMPTSEVGNMGNIAKIGRSSLGYRRYKADTAALSGNDMIYQKARSSFDVATRLSMLGGKE